MLVPCRKWQMWVPLYSSALWTIAVWYGGIYDISHPATVHGWCIIGISRNTICLLTDHFPLWLLKTGNFDGNSPVKYNHLPWTYCIISIAFYNILDDLMLRQYSILQTSFENRMPQIQWYHFPKLGWFLRWQTNIAMKHQKKPWVDQI